MTPKVGLVIPVYNRHEYVRRCFESLTKINHAPYVILICDDASTCRETTDVIGEYFPKLKAANKYDSRSYENKGVKNTLLSGIDAAFKTYGCDIVINLDSDSIVSPDFIGKLLTVHQSYSPTPVVSGFNCSSQRSPILVQEKGFAHKTHLNGINMCFNKEQYEKYIRPALTLEGNWDFNSSKNLIANNVPRLVITPSVVQHIGIQSSMGHVGADVAADFKPLHLTNVTLFGIDAHNPEGLKRAAAICQENIEFGAVKIITDRLFPGATREEGRRNYSKFMIKDLYRYIETDYVLTIHDDGYIQKWEAWDQSYLNYDYVGAIWDWYNENMVGNGGFSLRSKKLLHILATDENITDLHPEDDRICRHYRKYLEQTYDIKFAPVELAKKFSIEGYGLKPEFSVWNGEFGFHGRGVRNLPKPII